ncbi:MAG: aminotransferase class III-fold pyridoxal phosphate-dependent enzyme [Planctomycetaceae bacterium]|nr:aminotransferase class III-fold pyridoxal phosphate-dependent enzyme [Planctomycetaceae bacterium]
MKNDGTNQAVRGAPLSWRKYHESTKYIPQGTSTSSKTPLFEDSEPAQIARGKGCRVWDLDGNEYIDFRNGLGPVLLGYCFPQTDEAIINQLKNGIVFGHPHQLEGEVAELLVDNIPCAERVRFLKTGGEAIAACIKIARNATGRKKIIHCGYNGWLNSFTNSGFKPAGLTNARAEAGLPEEILALHSALPWANTTTWEQTFSKYGKDIAAVVIAPDYPEMAKGKDFLPQIRILTQKYGSLMIMDEIVTGFRLALGGAHQYFDFMPDLAVFSKGLSNGMPLSAYLGKSELIDSSRKIGISSTFGGETLSLASAKACINFIKNNNVIPYLWQIAETIWPKVNSLFVKYKVDATIKGFNVCPYINFADFKTKQAFFNACYKNNISMYHVPYVNYSHKKNDIEEALVRIEKAILEISGR